MTTVNEIIKLIEKTAPLSLAYPWDNSGLLIGARGKEVNRIYITLDTNKYTADEAVRLGADMIVSHHPIMFGGIKQIDCDSPSGYVISELIKHDIALYAAHTSMDCAAGGINDMLAERLGITGTEIIEENPDFAGCGLGRIGTVKEQNLKDFAETVKAALNTPFVRMSGDPEKIIKRAAVGGGACDDLIPAARMMGADVMVTADMKYHITMDSVESGIAVIDAGHYPTEVFVTDIFKNILKDCGAELVISSEKDVFEVV